MKFSVAQRGLPTKLDGLKRNWNVFLSQNLLNHCCSPYLAGRVGLRRLLWLRDLGCHRRRLHRVRRRDLDGLRRRRRRRGGVGVQQGGGVYGGQGDLNRGGRGGLLGHHRHRDLRHRRHLLEGRVLQVKGNWNLKRKKMSFLTWLFNLVQTVSRFLVSISSLSTSIAQFLRVQRSNFKQ